MAELQWIIEVRCINTLLAEVKVGERGEHFCVLIPDREFDPSEFNKLIEGLEEARRIAEEHRKSRPKPEVEPVPTPIDTELGSITEIENRSGLYEIGILKTGELVSVNASRFFAPSEFDRFIADVKAIRSSYPALQQAHRTV